MTWTIWFNNMLESINVPFVGPTRIVIRCKLYLNDRLVVALWNR